MTDKNVELLAPAGSLEAGLRGLKAGADALYFGLQRFSARAGAANFSFDEARILRSYSRSLGKNIYAAVNTLVFDSEWSELQEVGRFLEYLEVDGVIVQDWGVARYFRENHPSLPLHGSTQMAIHDLPGLHWAVQAGLVRVVLPREMTAEETGSLVAGARAEPSLAILEFESFIHGAQCYGFSGLCLASSILTGRSANRGQCSQICRTWFDTPKSPAGTRSYPLSANDKALGDQVQEMVALGVRSLKIEGRMKSPEYVERVVRWYRDILDKGLDTMGESAGSVFDTSGVRSGSNAPSGKPAVRGTVPGGSGGGGGAPASGGARGALGSFAEAKAGSSSDLRTTFARNWTPGFWGNRRGQDMVNTEHPGATGIRGGRVEKVGDNRFFTVLAEDLGVRDGVLLRSQGSWVAAGVRSLTLSRGPNSRGRDDSAGTPSPTSAVAGDGVWIYALREDKPVIPDPGSEFRILSRGTKSGSGLGPEAIAPFRPRVTLECRVRPGSLELVCPWFTRKFDVPTEPGRDPRGLEGHLVRLFVLGGTDFEWEVVVDDPEGLFIPPSALKEVRRVWIEEVQGQFWSTQNGVTAEESDSGPLPEPKLAGNRPRRSGLRVQNLPFYFPGDSLEPWIELSARFSWSALWLPLFPLSLGLPPWEELHEYLAKSDRMPVVLGLGNPSAAWMWAHHWSTFPATYSFLDYGLYAPNSLAAKTYNEFLPRLLSLEGQKSLLRAPEIPATWEGRESGALPFFLSRVCYRRQEQGDSCAGCPHLKKVSREVWERVITQGNTIFSVSTYRCWSIIQEKYGRLGP